jgi:hypothetical protein
MGSKTTLERAFELARGGEHRTWSEIAAQLRREGHYDADSQLSGMSLRRQLAGLISQARASAAAE